MNLVIWKQSLSAESVLFEKVLAPETGAEVGGRSLLHEMAVKNPTAEAEKLHGRDDS